MSLKDTPDGGVEGKHQGKKVLIKPVGDGFDVEMIAAEYISRATIRTSTTLKGN